MVTENIRQKVASKSKVMCKQVEKSIKKKYGKFGKVKFYKSENLKNKTLLHRKGNGKFYYICYAGWIKNVKKGMKVTSYFVYNKDTNYTDDIIERYDVVVKR